MSDEEKDTEATNSGDVGNPIQGLTSIQKTRASLPETVFILRLASVAGISINAAGDVLESMQPFLKPIHGAACVVDAARKCRDNRPANYTHGYVCGYLEGVSAMESTLFDMLENQKGEEDEHQDI